MPLEDASLPSADIELNRFVGLIRAYIRDYPELNRLTAGEESSNRQILWALMFALDDFNTTPPFTQFSVRNFPSVSLLVEGTVCWLLKSVGLLQTRNHLQFSDGGIQVGISDKTPYLQSWLQVFSTSYEEKKTRLKVAYNIESAWGPGLPSEYTLINSLQFYGGW